MIKRRNIRVKFALPGPWQSGWVDDFRTASSIYPVTLDLSIVA
ncbi:MAG: hypothetical protein ACYSUD_14715 [Planctomycetota bacterium]